MWFTYDICGAQGDRELFSCFLTHYRKFCAQHGPLSVEIVTPAAKWSTLKAEKALGAAYWRSDTV
jgi:hypothetical protein